MTDPAVQAGNQGHDRHDVIPATIGRVHGARADVTGITAGSKDFNDRMAGRLPAFLCPPECRGQLDFVAFDYYFGTPLLHRIGRLAEVLDRRYDRAPIWAAGLYDALRYFQDMFPEKPIFVIENGFAGLPHRPDRARYLRDHIRQVQKARQDGVKVIGYLAWSLTTNREWGLPPEPGSDQGIVVRPDGAVVVREWIEAGVPGRHRSHSPP